MKKKGTVELNKVHGTKPFNMSLGTYCTAVSLCSNLSATLFTHAGRTSDGPGHSLCGQHSNVIRYSTGRRILIEFKSDGIREASGFNVVFEQHAPESLRKCLV